MTIELGQEEMELEVRPQTTVSYSRTYNLGNYENEKLFVSLPVEDGETPQQAMVRARAMVEEIHGQFQAERDRADKIASLNHTADMYRRGIKRYQDLLRDANQPLPVIKPVSPAEAEVDSDDVIVSLEATIEVLRAVSKALEDAYHAYLHKRNSQVKAAQDEEDYEEDDDEEDDEEGEIDL